MIEHSNSREHNAELRLAWDMAHAEVPLRDEIQYLKANSIERSRSWGDYRKGATVQELLTIALERSSAVEQAYQEKLAAQDEDYLAIDALYEGVTVNKDDLYTFLSGEARDQKELKIADQLTTRVWNMLGEVSKRPNSDVLFGETQPTGTSKPGYLHRRNFVGEEVAEYRDLELASLIHFLDAVQDLTEGHSKIRGIGPVSLRAMMDFADYETQGIVNSRYKDHTKL